MAQILTITPYGTEREMTWNLIVSCELSTLESRESSTPVSSRPRFECVLQDSKFCFRNLTS